MLEFWWGRLFDGRDQRRAQLLRLELGARLWLVSWSRRRDGRWLARVSCPQFDATFERSGWSRCEAIRRAEGAIRRLLSVDEI